MSDSALFSPLSDVPTSGSVWYRWSRILDWVPTYASNPINPGPRAVAPCNIVHSVCNDPIKLVHVQQHYTQCLQWSHHVQFPYSWLPATLHMCTITPSDLGPREASPLQHCTKCTKCTNWPKGLRLPAAMNKLCVQSEPIKSGSMCKLAPCHIEHSAELGTR
jgi:hypothetical protein